MNKESNSPTSASQNFLCGCSCLHKQADGGPGKRLATVHTVQIRTSVNLKIAIPLLCRYLALCCDLANVCFYIILHYHGSRMNVAKTSNVYDVTCSIGVYGA